jgi:hypothetical protein
LLARLIARFHDITGTYLRHVVSTAIFGPNQLEFSFPVEYDLGRKACEKPEVISRIESALLDITGRPVRLRLKSVAGAVVNGPAAAQPTAAPTARRAAIEDPDDPLVKEVGRVFGVPAWVVQDLGRTRAGDVVVDDAET